MSEKLKNQHPIDCKLLQVITSVPFCGAAPIQVHVLESPKKSQEASRPEPVLRSALQSTRASYHSPVGVSRSPPRRNVSGLGHGCCHSASNSSGGAGFEALCLG